MGSRKNVRRPVTGSREAREAFVDVPIHKAAFQAENSPQDKRDIHIVTPVSEPKPTKPTGGFFAGLWGTSADAEENLEAPYDESKNVVSPQATAKNNEGTATGSAGTWWFGSKPSAATASETKTSPQQRPAYVDPTTMPSQKKPSYADTVNSGFKPNRPINTMYAAPPPAHGYNRSGDLEAGRAAVSAYPAKAESDGKKSGKKGILVFFIFLIVLIGIVGAATYGMMLYGQRSRAKVLVASSSGETVVSSTG